MKKFLLLLLAVAFVISPVFAEEKSGFTDLKAKIGVGCSVLGNKATVRIWPTDNLGLEFSAGLTVGDSIFTLPISAALVFPILEKGNFAVNISPGIAFTYNKFSNTISGFSFAVGGDLLLEMALPMISENLSIGSGIGAWFSYYSNTTTVGGNSNTASNIMVQLASVSPVFVRYYF